MLTVHFYDSSACTRHFLGVMNSAANRLKVDAIKCNPLATVSKNIYTY